MDDEILLPDDDDTEIKKRRSNTGPDYQKIKAAKKKEALKMNKRVAVFGGLDKFNMIKEEFMFE